jgi:hypothetical protein
MTNSHYPSGHLFALDLSSGGRIFPLREIADNENAVLVGLLRLRADHA